MWQIDRRQQMIILAILAVLLFGAGYRYANYRPNQPVETPVLKQAEESAPKPQTIMVYITGAVEKPGVYTLKKGDRVIDGINKAGIKSDADLDHLNLAAPLTDGQQVVVLGKTASENKTSSGANGANGANGTNGSSVSSSNGLVNINSASVTELDSLPGIGPSLAQRMVDYRESNGGFKSVEEVKKVPGIGEKKFSDLKDSISLY